MQRAIVLAVVAVVVAACENPYLQRYPITEESVLSADWITPRVMGVEPLYCYRTLADAECSVQPIPSQASRLVGYFGPQPY